MRGQQDRERRELEEIAYVAGARQLSLNLKKILLPQMFILLDISPPNFLIRVPFTLVTIRIMSINTKNEMSILKRYKTDTT
jgi:hypothetical protein